MAKSGQLARCGKNPQRAAFSLAGSLLASALNSNCKYIFRGISEEPTRAVLAGFEDYLRAHVVAGAGPRTIRASFSILFEKHLPLGQKGWKLVIAAFCEWADASGRPARDGKAIEGKYKMLLKTKKPTATPTALQKSNAAHQIESLINEKADTREISNDSF
ncbi:hypothetical protein B0H14DRAFT_3464874 [Mycena olivaceomarginata]|nr:hypothetical protein B0H14DRAFT_3464874 [Mycena olivaceomarginata]